MAPITAHLQCDIGHDLGKTVFLLVLLLPPGGGGDGDDGQLRYQDPMGSGLSASGVVQTCWPDELL